MNVKIKRREKGMSEQKMRMGKAKVKGKPLLTRSDSRSDSSGS